MKTVGWVSLAGFVGCVWLANWLLTTYGIVDIGFGLMAPAGVFAAGLSFGMRDAVHESLGRWWVLVGVAAGTALSLLLSEAVTLPDGTLLASAQRVAVASGVAFAISELLDLAVYSPLRDRNWPSAVVASNIVGAVADSALFLWLCFGSLDHIAGQIVGKTYMVAVALPVVWWARRRRECFAS